MLNEQSIGTWLIVVRHGATDRAGAQNGFGRADHDPTLTPLGGSQAHALAAVLAAELPRPLSLWVSPRRRAQQTLAPLAAALQMTPKVLPHLDEIDYGRWAGRSRDDIAQAEGAEGLAAWDRLGLAPADAGFVPDALTGHAQARAFAKQIASEGRHALVMSHNGRVRTFSGLDPTLVPARRRLGLGAVGLLWRARPIDSPWRVIAWDVDAAQAAERLRTPLTLA